MVPTRRLGAFTRALPALTAERSLRRIDEVALAFGSVEEHEARRYMQRLRVDAGGREPAERATVASLALMRIGVETIEAEEGGDAPLPSSLGKPS